MYIENDYTLRQRRMATSEASGLDKDISKQIAETTIDQKGEEQIC